MSSFMSEAVLFFSYNSRFLIILAPQVLYLTSGEKDYLLFPVIGKGGHVLEKTVEELFFHKKLVCCFFFFLRGELFEEGIKFWFYLVNKSFRTVPYEGLQACKRISGMW